MPALLLYAYLLTIEDEVELIWRKNMGLSSWIFLANRVGGVLLLVSVVVVGTSVCIRLTVSMVQRVLTRTVRREPWELTSVTVDR